MAKAEKRCTKYFIQTESLCVENEGGRVSVGGGAIWQLVDDDPNMHLINRDVNPADVSLTFLSTGKGLEREKIPEFQLKFKEIDEKTYFFLLAIPDNKIRLYFHSNDERLSKGLKIEVGTRVVVLPPLNSETAEALDKYYSPSDTEGDRGTVRYVGSTNNIRGNMFGVELDDEDEGTCNGFFQGYQYFTCADNGAFFCAAHRLLPLSHSGNNLCEQNPILSDVENFDPKIQLAAEKDLNERLTSSLSSIASLADSGILSYSDVDQINPGVLRSEQSPAQNNLNLSRPHPSSAQFGQSPIQSNEQQLESDQIQCQSERSIPKFSQNLSSSDQISAQSDINISESGLSSNVQSNEGSAPLTESSHQNDLQFSDQAFDSLGSASSCSGEALQVGERIVLLENMEYGTVRWIGYLPGSTNNSDSTRLAGVEFDNPVGKGTGRYRKEQLFSTEKNHAGFIPIVGLMRERDFVAGYPTDSLAARNCSAGVSE